MQEALVQSLGWEDPLEKGKATKLSILAWRILGVAKSQTWLSNFHFHFSKEVTNSSELKFSIFSWKESVLFSYITVRSQTQKGF